MYYACWIPVESTSCDDVFIILNTLRYNGRGRFIPLPSTSAHIIIIIYVPNIIYFTRLDRVLYILLLCGRKTSFLLRHYLHRRKASSNKTGPVTPRNPWASLICISVPADRRHSLVLPLPKVDVGGTSPFIIITRLFITLCKYYIKRGRISL